jgi:prepilin-type N-terminal cleavage/methylation domain-containing protein
MIRGFSLIELLVVVAIIGILAAVGITAYSGYTYSAKLNVAQHNHKSVVSWFQLKAMQCELEGKITYTSWSNRGQQDSKACKYNNGWSLVMDLGYNHIRYHFLAEGQYSDNFSNPFDRTRYVEWQNHNANSCGNIIGQTTFYGYQSGSSEFQIWTNIDGECLYDRVEFPL